MILTLPELLIPFHNEKYTMTKTAAKQRTMVHLTLPRFPKPSALSISKTFNLKYTFRNVSTKLSYVQCLAEVSAPVLFLPLDSIVNMSCKNRCCGARSCTFHPSKMPFYHSRVKLTSFSTGI